MRTMRRWHEPCHSHCSPWAHHIQHSDLETATDRHGHGGWKQSLQQWISEHLQLGFVPVVLTTLGWGTAEPPSAGRRLSATSFEFNLQGWFPNYLTCLFKGNLSVYIIIKLIFKLILDKFLLCDIGNWSRPASLFSVSILPQRHQSL